MPAPHADDLAPLLAAARRGDDGSVARLFELLYADLRRMAHARLHEAHPRDALLDTTVLVHESFERFNRLARLDVTDRGHFMAYASRVMRSVIVDVARERLAERRGGGAAHVTLTTGFGERLSDPAQDPEVLRVHEALQALATMDARLAQVVEMRYYGGLDNTEIAQALDVSLRTVERDWERARLYLFATLSEG